MYVLRRLACHFEAGAEKYEARNWEKGQPTHLYADSALRHIFLGLEGDRSEDNYLAAIWNLAGLVHTEEMIRRGVLPDSLDTLPKPGTYGQVREKVGWSVNAEYQKAPSDVINDPTRDGPRSPAAQQFAKDHLGESDDNGAELVQAGDGYWDILVHGYWWSSDDENWHERCRPGAENDQFGAFSERVDAEEALPTARRTKVPS